ncbi:MAG: AAA family ATPase [Oscillospiraceae bacterium]|nr:AAA family ATPase [Oscillospiraceae bacterium]
MYLKALEIQGFKSFPEKTTLTFENNITGIVGPNGSGKSNISDAILWVMGEQRTKTLRGSKMEDVIFGGTEKRTPLSYAQVTLLLDNSDHLFDLDTSEVSISRRYYRSGDSEYYINKEQVRLKDVNSLLMDTGLGRDGYSVIGQGRISEIISNKSADRREVMEEAAGISRFRYRKEDAERKLQKTEENLVRVNDKIEELELQVEPLRRQSEVAKKYLQIHDVLRVKEISAWMASLDKLRDNSDAVNSSYEEAKEKLAQAHAELDALYASSDSLLERMHQKDIEADDAREKLSQVQNDISANDAERAVIDTNIRNAFASIERMKGDISNSEQRATEICEQIDNNEKLIRDLEAENIENQEKLDSANNIIRGCDMKIQSRQATVDSLQKKQTSLQVESRSMDSRIQLLSAMEKEFQGYSNAVRTVMKEASHKVLKGIHGPVASLIKAEDQYALAIETAMGGAMQNIVVSTQNDGRSAIELLKREDAGRATFLPIDVIRGNVQTDLPTQEKGFVGLAYDLVSYDRQYDGIIANLLGRTIVAQTLADAIRMSKNNSNRLRIVTLDGQLINAGGSMTGGSYVRNAGMLSRANELERLKQDKVVIENNIIKNTKELDEATNDLQSVQYQRSMAVEDQISIQNMITSNVSKSSATSSAISQLKALLQAITGDSESRRNAIENEELRVAGMKQQLDALEKKNSTLQQRLDHWKDEIKKIVDTKMDLEGKRNQTDRSVQDSNKELLNLERSVAKLEQKKIAADMEEKQLLDKLWDNYELSYTSAQEIRQPLDSLQKTNKEIAELRRQLGALGTPNLGAIEEYERVSERYNFLTSQRDDIDKSKKELLVIINDITSEMVTVFIDKFNQINKAFQETFLELFGGGKAALVLEDEDNVLDCGIEIQVQPPGKALSSLSLLSGGEMAFVAIALYFAIIKVRPTPFCVMDEIEAALDESNVLRYADYMRKYSQHTQFIVITHRRGTMENTDFLYGVTMQEKGVSKVLALSMEETEKTIKAAKR